MQARTYPPFLWQVGLAVVAGTACGWLIGRMGAHSPSAVLVEQFCIMAAYVASCWLRALTVPLIFSSIVLGSVGLEPMRGLGRLVGKTLAWMAGTTLVAILVVVAVVGVVGSKSVQGFQASGLSTTQGWPDTFHWVSGWLSLVLFSLACGYYRNQLEEGRGKLFARFCQGTDEMLAPMLRWTQAASAVGLFVFFAARSATCTPYLQGFSRQVPTNYLPVYGQALAILLGASLLYCVGLMAVVWGKTKAWPGRYFPVLVPALLVAASGQAVETTLPLSMDALRHRAGVSNRVAGTSLSLCAVLQRDGMALGWAAVLLASGLSADASEQWHTLLYATFAAFLVGIGLGALSGASGLLPLLFLDLKAPAEWAVFTYVVGWVVVLVGGAVSVFSHACITILIARSEGEYWVPGPPPDPDELQGLKNDLALADS